MPHVNRIEMRGFKSFGNTKVGLPFSPGLTAVVGPNGSGKSNIVDAFCFVLGGMSAKTMRAERFSDLLFNGGNGQRPAPFAEVSLYFDNEDGDIQVDSKTVIVTRRVDRSGKCVYRINKKRVNRQDIIDLLSKSTLGFGEYNFVMQGDVDRFIKMDPVERRVIIDDLAGVAEYEEKKEKSLAELQRVEINLKSMEGILNEVSTQLEKLRQERENAIRYKEMRVQLDFARAILSQIEYDRCKQKLCKLKEKINETTVKLSELQEKSQKTVNEISSREDDEKKLSDLIEKKQSARVIATAEKLRERISTLEDQIASANKERVWIEKEIPNVQATLENIEKTRKPVIDPQKLLKEVNGFLSEFQGLYREFGTLSSALISNKRLSPTEMRNDMKNLQRVLQKMNFVLKELNARIEHASEFVVKPPQSIADDQSGELRDRLVGLKAQHSQINNRIEGLQKEIQAVKIELEKTAAQEAQEQKLLRHMREKKRHIQNDVSLLEKKEAELREKIRVVESELNDYRVDEARLQTQLDGIKKDVKSVKLKEKVPEDVDVSKLPHKIEVLEAQLEALGPVNFRAIQEFKITEDRYNSERARYDKLISEKQAILDFIQKVDKKKTETFMKTFNEISKNFSNIFSELSPGGSARLVLENWEHPFEGGLEIEAKPAGKEVARVGAMSGGERALTALGFIFALQRARPAGFYIFDEIDAHLDDENLRRVAKILQRCAQRSQMVVVTLKDSMMSAADRLFGVTIDKSGISHLLSVELGGLAA